MLILVFKKQKSLPKYLIAAVKGGDIFEKSLDLNFSLAALNLLRFNRLGKHSHWIWRPGGRDGRRFYRSSR